jgi:hypothetical protein
VVLGQIQIDLAHELQVNPLCVTPRTLVLQGSKPLTHGKCKIEAIINIGLESQEVGSIDHLSTIRPSQIQTDL